MMQFGNLASGPGEFGREWVKGHGCLPVHAQGSRWLNHKRKTLQRVANQFGAHLSYLFALCENTYLKSEERACLKE